MIKARDTFVLSPRLSVKPKFVPSNLRLCKTNIIEPQGSGESTLTLEKLIFTPVNIPK